MKNYTSPPIFVIITVKIKLLTEDPCAPLK